MARGINEVTIIGRLGKDPETRYSKDGDAVTTLSVATESWQGKEKEPKTQWHRCLAFKNTAETLAQYLQKGSQIYLKCEIDYDSYMKDGVKIFTTQLLIRTFEFIDAKTDKPQSAPQPVTQNMPDDFDDDIPF